MGDCSMKPAKASNSIFLQIKENQDGSITRPFFPLSHHPLNSSSSSSSSTVVPPVLTRDIALNSTTNTWLRLYLPRVDDGSGPKLPVIIFLHGGGFLLFSPSSLFYHQFCHGLSLSLPALVVSVAYRLAPEHRLPAAYHDAAEAIEFVHESEEAWIADHGDRSRLFVMGSSSGANIAYHAALGISALSNIAGLVLNQPYFGGSKRTKSESGSEEDAVLPLRANDMMWRLALPTGSDRDHQYCNPMGPTAVTAEFGRLPRCLVRGSGGDPLVDRQREFVGMLEGAGVKVVAKFDEEGHHAAELFDSDKANVLFDEVRDFVYGGSS